MWLILASVSHSQDPSPDWKPNFQSLGVHCWSNAPNPNKPNGHHDGGCGCENTQVRIRGRMYMMESTAHGCDDAFPWYNSTVRGDCSFSACVISYRGLCWPTSRRHSGIRFAALWPTTHVRHSGCFVRRTRAWEQGEPRPVRRQAHARLLRWDVESELRRSHLVVADDGQGAYTARRPRSLQQRRSTGERRPPSCARRHTWFARAPSGHDHGGPQRRSSRPHWTVCSQHGVGWRLNAELGYP